MTDQEIPLQQTLVDRGHYGEQRAEVAEGQLPDGTRWEFSIADNNDAFTQGKVYSLVVGSHVAAVHVSESGAVISVRNQVGRVNDPQGQVQAEALVAAMRTARENGFISPHELNILSPQAESIASMAARPGRVTNSRGGAQGL